MDKRRGKFVVGTASRKALETKNSKLKKLLAETMLDKAMLKDNNSKRC